jgi:hypothetical protein
MPPIRRSGIDLWLQAFAVFSMSGIPSYIFLTALPPSDFPRVAGTLCGSISLDGLHCPPFATCGVENPRYYDGGQGIRSHENTLNARASTPVHERPRDPSRFLSAVVRAAGLAVAPAYSRQPHALPSRRLSRGPRYVQNGGAVQTAHFAVVVHQDAL